MAIFANRSDPPALPTFTMLEPAGEVAMAGWVRFVLATALAVAVVAFVIVAMRQNFAAMNYFYAATIGVLTGGTELMQRYRDRPFAAVASEQGIGYMAVNAAAAVLALYMLDVANILETNTSGRVFLAGLSAMAVFRSGLMIVKSGKQDYNLGPGIVIKVMLDVLDREYGKRSAYRRSGIIRKAMDGIDFARSRQSLSELCLSLMQNVTSDERAELETEITRLGALTDMTDEARSMAFGLGLINIVGESTLEAAAGTLGANIVSFMPLSEELDKALAKPAAADVLANLLGTCNDLAHHRRKLILVQLEDLQGRILARTTLPELARAKLAVFQARQQYGEKVVLAALQLLPERIGTVPAPPAAGGAAASVPATAFPPLASPPPKGGKT